VRLLVVWEREGLNDLALGQQLRPELASTLRAFASALRSAQVRDMEDERQAGAAAAAVRALDESLDDLRQAVREAQRSSEYDYFVAGALIINLDRGADALRT
jgi:hypothetical protein